jgi:Ca-activated chloride channel family protein
LTITLADSLSKASIASPSHPIRYQGLNEGLALCLVGEQGMDRDFVLLIDLPQTIPAQAWLAPDQTGTSQLVNYLLTPPDSNYRTPLNLKILVDCSGSMQGESIAKSKQALLQIINQLTAEDQFSISRFGFHSEAFYPDLLPASRQYKHLAKAYIEKMDADMGGTEMEAALATCLAITDKQQKSVPADILLITDGQVNAEERMLNLMSDQQQRLFIVGISDAVSADFLTRLAHSGQGYADFIYPQEEVEPVIQRMFERLRGDYVVNHQLNWSNNDIAWQTNIPSRIFANESLIFGAKFNQPLTNMSADLSFTWRSGAQTSIHIPSQVAAEDIAHDLPRIVARLYLSRSQVDNASQLAQDYQLLTQDTALFMQLAREANEKGDTNPMLVSIPNPLPKSSAHNYLSGTFLMRYDTSVGSIQNPVFFSQSSAGIDHSGFAISVNETDPTPSQVIEPSVIEVMLNNQPLTSYLPIQTIEDAHNFINALEATLSEIKREIPMSKKNKSQYIKKFRTLRSELFIAIENDFHLLWEDELLEDIYADLLQRLEDRVEQALEGLLVEINRLIMSEDVKSSLIGRL